MTVVVDASVLVRAVLTRRWPAGLRKPDRAAPTLIWSELASAIRQLEFRGEIGPGEADAAMAWLPRASVAEHPSRDLVAEARTLARSVGWAKTYDAEYIVLARRLGATLVTADARLRARAATLVSVAGPAELR